MPIVAQEIIDRVRQVGLDAEGADYYDTTLDIIPFYYQMESSDKRSMMMHHQKINNSILSALSGILTCDDTIEDPMEEDIRRLREGSVVGAYIDNEKCKSLDHITLSLSFISHKY